MKVLESLFRKSCEKLKEDECLPKSHQKSVWDCGNFFRTVRDYFE